MPGLVQDYYERQRQADDASRASAAAVVLDSVEAKPDEAASDLTIANDYAKITGRPAPPLEIVKGNRSIFENEISRQQNSTILRSAPKLADWLRDPQNAALAKDDVAGLSWWETLGKQTAEAAKAIPGGAVSSAGTAMEGAGQILTPADPAVRNSLAGSIAGAGTRTPEQIGELRQQIFGQGDINPQFAQSVLSDVLSGDMSADEAMRALEPMFEPALKAASQALQGGGEKTQAFAQSILPAEPGMENSFGRQVGSGLGSLLTILGVGLATGGAGAATFGAAAGAGEAASNARKAGQDEDTQTIAAFYGILPGMTDAIPVERLLSNPATKAGFAHFLRSVGLQAATEGGQEAVQQILQNAIAANLYAPDQSLMKDVASNFATGGFVGAMVEAGKIGLQAALPGRFHRAARAAEQAPATQEQIAEIGGQAAASKLRTRMPDAFRRFVEKATDNGPVENIYVAAETFATYFQGLRVDPYELVGQMDGVTADDLRTALETGGDLRIPTATFAAKLAGSEHDQFFAENAKFDPDGMTAVEAAEFNERSQDALQEAYDEAERMRIDDEQYRSFEGEIYDTMVSRLREAGRATDVATTEAMLFPAFYRVMAQRSGMTTEDFLRRYPLPEVRGAIPQGVRSRKVDELTRALAAARSQRQAATDSRQSLLEWISEYGGINDVGGELKARDAEVVQRGRGRRNLRLRREEGAQDLAGRKFGPDDIAQAAIEAGYLADDPRVVEGRAASVEGREQPDTVPALWEAIDRELRGERQFAGEARAEEGGELDQIEQYLGGLGVSLADTDETIRAAIEADQARDGKRYAQPERGAITFPVGAVGRGNTIVELFGSADLSTVIHESGHYFYAVLQDMAEFGETSAQADIAALTAWHRDHADEVARDAVRATAADFEITGADVQQLIDEGSSGDAVKDSAIRVGMHEQFARGFESYLMEGKAPSSALRQAFEKMRAWLTAIYRRLASLDVQPTPEIRAVFDRMLATDQEITDARDSSGEIAPDLTAEDLGMSPEQYAALLGLRTQAKDQAAARLLRETMEPIRRERERWYKEEKERVRNEIAAETNKQPVYRSFEWMANRRWLDEDMPDGLAEMRLNKDELVRRFGPGVLKTLPRGQFTLYAVEGGVDPDFAAGIFGFESGDQMIRALETAPPRGEAIRAQTERVMFERHGDALRDGTVEAEALDAVHNDHRARALAAELKALNEIAGTDRGMTFPEAREIARRTLAGARVRDARASGRYLAAERKAGQEAVRLAAAVTRTSLWAEAAQRRVQTAARGAVRENDTTIFNERRLPKRIDTANASVGRANEEAGKLVEAKRRQLLNHALFSESRKIDVEVEAARDRLAKLDRPDKRLGERANIDHVKAARAIAARFGLARPDPAFEFNAWLEQLRFDDPVAAAAMQTAIDTYTQTPVLYRDLTVDEFRAVVDAVNSVIETAKRFRQLEVEGKLVERDEAIADLTAVLRNRGLRDNPAMQAKLTGAQRMGKAALTMVAGLRRTEAWARDMDEGEQGAFTRYIVKPVADAVGIYREQKTSRLQEMLAILEPRKKDLLTSGIIEAPEFGHRFTTKAELIHAILHTGNESNLEKLLLGRGWSDGLVGQVQAVTAKGAPRVSRKTGEAIMTRGRVDTSRWDGFIQRMISEGRLTKDDYDLVQSIWDLMEALKRPAQSAHRKMYGHYFHEIEATPLDTPFGTYRGGYVPAIADKDASLDGEIRIDQQAMEGGQQSSFMFPTTGSGFTKSRVQNYRTPLALDLMLLPSHLDKVLRFTHIQPAVMQTFGLVNQRQMREVLNGFDPAIASNMLVPWLQRTATQIVETQKATGGGRAVSAFFRGVRRRVGVGTMFLNVVNTLQQLFSLPTAAILVKPTHMKASVVRFATDAGAMREEATAASNFMRDRIEDGGRLLNRRIEEAITPPTVAGEIRSWVDRHGYVFQTGLQNMIDVATWHAAYDQAIAGGMTDADATFEADSVIRRVYGSFAPEDISAFETGNAFERLFTMFYSFFNGQANLVGGEMQTVLRNMGWAGAPRAAMIFALGVTIPAVFSQLLMDGLRGDLGDDDDDGYLDDLAELFFGSQIKYVAGAVPIAGQLTVALINQFNDVPYDDRLSAPATGAAERLLRAPFSIKKAIFNDGSSQKAVGDGLYALGIITGIPTGQLSKTLSYVAGVAEGKSGPESVVDIGQGLISGRDGTER